MLKKVLLWLALAASPHCAQAQSFPAYPYVHTSGTGVINAMPDTGEINFEIAASDADPAVARGVVDTRIAELRELVAQTCMAGDALQIQDVRQDMKKGESLAIYELRTSVKIVVRDLGKWRQVVQALLGKPNLDGYFASFDISTRAQIEKELMAQAVKAARGRAKSMATGFGRKLGAATAVTSSEIKNVSRAMNLSASEPRFNGAPQNRQDPADLLSVTSVRLMQKVDVIFKML